MKVYALQALGKEHLEEKRESNQDAETHITPSPCLGMELPSDTDMMTRCMSSFSYKIKNGKRLFRCRNPECQMPFPSDYSRKNHEKAMHDPESIHRTRAPASKIIGFTVRSSKKRDIHDGLMYNPSGHMVPYPTLPQTTHEHAVDYSRSAVTYPPYPESKSHHSIPMESLVPRQRSMAPQPMYVFPSQLSNRHYSPGFDKAGHSIVEKSPPNQATQNSATGRPK